MKYFLSLASLIFLLAACTKDEDAQFNEDMKLIEQYIASSNLANVQSDENGLHYVLREAGTGSVALDTSLVKVAYEGRLLNGNIFDRNDEAQFRVNGLVPGFSQALLKLREGGDILVIIPSGLAYGSTARSGIPSNSILIFDIKLLEVVQ